MIIEDYVSFETAKLLKEKGFDYAVHQYYKENGEVCNNPKSVASWRVESWCPCATLQMAMKWLREKKGIAVIPVLSSVLDNEKFLWDVKIVVAKHYDVYYQRWVYENQEEACENGIKYCLENLIEDEHHY